MLSGGNALPSLPIASALSGTTLNQAVYVPTGGLPEEGPRWKNLRRR